MTWVLVLIFLAGPMAGHPFMLGTYGKGVPDRFQTEAQCEKRALEAGPKVEKGFKDSKDPDVQYPFALACREVKLGSDV